MTNDQYAAKHGLQTVTGQRLGAIHINAQTIGIYRDVDSVATPIIERFNLAERAQ